MKAKPDKMRLFKVYALIGAAAAGHWELCFAGSHEQAAEIVQTVWRENGLDQKRFLVRELVLPDVQHGTIIGFVYEPNTKGKTIVQASGR